MAALEDGLAEHTIDFGERKTRLDSIVDQATGLYTAITGKSDFESIYYKKYIIDVFKVYDHVKDCQNCCLKAFLPRMKQRWNGEEP